MNKFTEIFATKPILLAPMFEVTNLPFRLFCKDQGANASITEFVSVNQLLYVFKNDTLDSNAVRYLIQTTEQEKPVGLQVFGFDPVHFSELGKILDIQKLGFDFLDLNIGCPVPKICNIGAGSKLLATENISKLELMLKSIKKAFPDTPFSIKIRAGYKKFLDFQKFADMINAIDLLHVTIHPKLAVNPHKEQPNVANHELTKQFVEVVDHPVILNGGITSINMAMDMMNYTKAAGAMIGRQAQKYPWVFNPQYQEAVPTQNYITDLHHFLDLNKEFGFGKLYMVRDQILGTVRGFSGSKHKRVELQRKLSSIEELYSFLGDVEQHFDKEGIEGVRNIVPKKKVVAPL